MKKLSRFIIFFLPFLISACGFYHPNLRNSPMLTKAGEVQGSVQLSRGFEAQGAVAVTNHIGLLANYHYVNKGKPENDFENRNFFEGGVGYFMKKEKSFYEVYAGYGQGDSQLLNWTEMSGPERYSIAAKFRRFFIQPSFGYHNKRHSVAFAPRLSYVEPIKFATTRPDSDFFKTGWSLEMAGIERWHVHKNIFLTFQGGVNLPLSSGLGGMPFLQVGFGGGFRFNAQREF